LLAELHCAANFNTLVNHFGKSLQGFRFISFPDNGQAGFADEASGDSIPLREVELLSWLMLNPSTARPMENLVYGIS
jgi:hypothetical protein